MVNSDNMNMTISGNDFIDVIKNAGIYDSRYEAIKNAGGFDNIVYAVIAGSKAYGIADSSSDVDLRIIVAPTVEEMLQNRKYRIKTYSETDTLVIKAPDAIKRAILALPGFVELFGVDDDSILFQNEAMRFVCDDIADYITANAIDKSCGGMARRYAKAFHEAYHSVYDDASELTRDARYILRQDDRHKAKLIANIIRVLNMASDMLDGNGIISKRPESECRILREIRAIDNKYMIDGIPTINAYDAIDEAFDRYRIAFRRTTIRKDIGDEDVEDFIAKAMESLSY